MNTTLKLMKKNVVTLDGNSDELENIIDRLEWLVERESTSNSDKAELRGSIKRLRAINDTIVRLIGDDLVHILENDAEYHNSNIKVGLDEDINRMCDDYEYKEWLRDVNIKKVTEKEPSKSSISNIPPEIFFKLGKIIGGISKFSSTLDNVNEYCNIPYDELRKLTKEELDSFKKLSIEIAQDLFSFNR